MLALISVFLAFVKSQNILCNVLQIVIPATFALFYLTFLKLAKKQQQQKKRSAKMLCHIQLYSLCKRSVQMAAHERTEHQERNMEIPVVITITANNNNINFVLN